jgi:hypothetical protein
MPPIAPVTTIAIQSIETWWTKASRGAPGAAARAASPRALPLMQTQGKTQVDFHRVLFDEHANFSARSGVVGLSLQEAQRKVPGVVLHTTVDAIHVMFTWDPYSLGAPERRNGHAIRLEAGQWCQIIHNGRLGDDAEWRYQETTLNIAYVPASPRIFLDSEPCKVDDHRGQLW